MQNAVIPRTINHNRVIPAIYNQIIRNLWQTRPQSDDAGAGKIYNIRAAPRVRRQQRLPHRTVLIALSLPRQIAEPIVRILVTVHHKCRSVLRRTKRELGDIFQDHTARVRSVKRSTHIDCISPWQNSANRSIQSIVRQRRPAAATVLADTVQNYARILRPGKRAAN